MKIILIRVTICIGIDVLYTNGDTILKFYIRTTQENILSLKVLYMRRTGAYGIENYKLMDTFKKWVQENNLYNEDTVIYAIPMDDPEKVMPCHCRYDVCINKPENRTFIQNQIECRDLESGKYLIFLIPHTADIVQTAWQMCFSELEKLGYSLDESRPIMERYKKRLVDKHYCELCMPIL